VSYGHSFYWGRVKKWEAWIPGALLVLAYGTSFVGIDFYRSFWSLFVRGDGLFMLTCALTNFYLILLFANQKFFKQLLYGVVALATFVAIYGIGEWLIAGSRIGSLLGNAAFFAGYLGITFFATLICAQTLNGAWRRALYVGALVQLLAIVLTATRGTLLALFVSGILFLLYTASTGVGKRRTISASILIGLVVCIGVFVTFRSELAHTSFTPLARIASVSTSEADVASRLFIWKNMVGEIKKSPWVGVGAEHIDVLFNRFYDPTQIYEQWFDRSHNAFLDYIAQYGIGGLLLYLALIATFLSTARREFLRGNKEYAILIVLLSVTYALQNFFVFDTVSSFWLLLALLATALSLSFTNVAPKGLLVQGWYRYIAYTVATGLLLLIIPTSLRSFEAAYNLAQSYHYQITDVQKEVKYLSQGFALGTYGDLEYGYQAYDMYANRQATFLTGDDLHSAYQATVSILTTDFNRYPYDGRIALYLAHVLTLAPQGVNSNQDLLSSALERSIRLSPKRSQPWYILVNLSIESANAYPVGSPERKAGYLAARDLMTRYISLVPTLSEPRFVLAQLAYASGDKATATASAELGKQYYTKDLETAKRAAVYYETVLNLENAAYFLEEVVRLDPTDTAAAKDLLSIQNYEQSKK
jgi:O-antigen ligase